MKNNWKKGKDTDRQRYNEKRSEIERGEKCQSIRERSNKE